LNIKNLQLIPDIRTRWNSTHNMLNRALILREVKSIFLIFIITNLLFTNLLIIRLKF